jgi:hypothetical protein
MSETKKDKPKPKGETKKDLVSSAKKGKKQIVDQTSQNTNLEFPDIMSGVDKQIIMYSFPFNKCPIGNGDQISRKWCNKRCQRECILKKENG